MGVEPEEPPTLDGTSLSVWLLDSVGEKTSWVYANRHLVSFCSWLCMWMISTVCSLGFTVVMSCYLTLCWKYILSPLSYFGFLYHRNINEAKTEVSMSKLSCLKQGTPRLRMVLSSYELAQGSFAVESNSFPPNNCNAETLPRIIVQGPKTT